MLQTLDLFGIQLNAFVTFNALGFFVAFIIIWFQFKKYKFSVKDYVAVVLIITFGGFVGSKIFYIFEEFSTFMERPTEVFFSFEGSGFFGGFTFVLILFHIYFKRKNIGVLAVLDACILCVPFGIILGRIGCFLAGDGCYGLPSSMPWAMTFPEGVMPTYIPVHPTQIYEIIGYSLIIVCMLRIEKYSIGVGFNFGYYLILSGIFRFFIEFFRMNIEVVFGLTAQQLFSFMFVCIGLSLIAKSKHALRFSMLERAAHFNTDGIRNR